MIDDVHALAAAYSLDALDPEERRRFEAHYPDCETCATEVLEFRETAVHLGAISPAPLPADLKARVMADVGRTRQLPPKVVPLSDRTRRMRPLLAVAAVLLIVLAAGGLFALRSNGGDGGSGGSSELAQVLGAPDAVTVKLKGPQPGTLRVVYSKDQAQAVLVGSDLSDPGADKTYQLWAIDGTTPASAGLFSPSDGSVDQVVEAPSSSPDAWGVTVEPEGGSPAPTGEILYSGTTA
jgi:anti-sigma-K factor RskA